MAKEKTPAEPTQEPQEPEKSEQPDIDALVKKSIAEVEANFKKEISGLNRRNSELEKELENAKKAGMQEQERLEYERKQALEERERAKQEAQEYRINLLRERKIHEAGLSPEFSKFVTGGDEEEISSQIQALQNAINAAAEKGLEAEIDKRFTNKDKPKAGKKEGELTYKDLTEMTKEQLAQFTPAQIAEITERG